MKTNGKRIDHAMISRLFFRLLPVQIAVVAMGSINSIVDGIVAARCIDATTVGVVGLYYTMVRILEAVGAVLLSGASVLSGRYLGSGRIDKTRGICSLGLTAALLIGGFLTVASFLAPRTIALWLGANESLQEALATYIRGYAVGIVPQLLAQQLASFLQLERQDSRGQAGIIGMITTNVVMDLLFVASLGMGIWGLALATSLANWVYFLILAPYYFTAKAQLKPGIRLASWPELPALLRIGFPNALLVACLAARSLIINRILLVYAGQNGLSALSAFNMISGLILSTALGAGTVVRMLSSVFVGEENREGLLGLMKVVCTRAFLLILGVTALVILLSPTMAGLFFPDRATEVFRLTRSLFILYAGCIPVILIVSAYSGYCQATEHRLFVNLFSLTDGFFSMVIPSLLLAPRLGALGVWLAFPIGLGITAGICVLYVIVRLKRWPRCMDDWLLLPDGFGDVERLILELRSLSEVTETARQVQRFCEERGIARDKSAYAGLCLEEMAGNIVRHGFEADRRPHVMELRVVIRQDDAILRIKDDCRPFDPKEWYEMTAPDDPAANIGIRLVFRLADEVTYQNLLGLNVLTIRLSNETA